MNGRDKHEVLFTWASVRLAKEVALGKAERTENWRPSPPASPAGRR